MLLSHKTTIKLSKDDSNMIGHMCYAASKLWNVCNYERYHYKEMKFKKYPDWYYQKSHHKNHVWYKSLPSQTAQEVCKLLDKSWKSFYKLQKTGGIEHPRPPRFKQEKMVITYMQNAVVHEKGSKRIRLSISKGLKGYMKETYDICENYLYLENKIFQNIDTIKQIKLYPPDEKDKCKIIVIYEIAKQKLKPDHGHYLSIDLGLHNLMTCYDSDGKTFLLGRKYLSICHRYHKKIAKMQMQWAKCQAAGGIKYPKPSKHLKKVYEKKNHTIHDYLHKITRYIADYCVKEQITVVVIGDITNIRSGVNYGKVTNQKLHSLPYKRIYEMLEYKLAVQGIRLVKQEESYSSQCAPNTKKVSKRYAVKGNRKHRGLYCDDDRIYNADGVGAYNILRKYIAVSGISKELPISGLYKVDTIEVAV